MKHILSLLAILALAITASAELKIISTEHRETVDFKRFSEYFSGKENQGRYTIFRSDTTQRTGFYISLETKKKADLENVSTIRLQYVRSSTQEVETQNFSASTINRKRLLVGLTESDWQEPNSRPVAWKIELLDSTNKTLNSAQSFLWSE